jgi:Protein of unknown function (DUF1493)
MMNSRTDIALEDMRSWLATRLSKDPSRIGEDDDLDHDLGIYGDGHRALLEAYSQDFHVDLRSYRWYFHTREQRHSFGSVFFEPPDKQVSHIPITPRLLVEAAKTGVWDPGYPTHELPGKRWGLVVNMAIIVFILVYLSWTCSR